jgi:transposase
MAKKSTPTFVVTLPLSTTPAQEKALKAKFEAGRKVYNAVVGEGRKRLRLLRGTKAWKQALQIHKDLEAIEKDKTLSRKEKDAQKVVLKTEQKRQYERAHQVLTEHHKTRIRKKDKVEVVERTLKNIKRGGAFTKWTSQFNYCDHISHHLDSQVIKTLTSRAQTVVMNHLWGDNTGKKGGRPKFKSFQTLRALEGGNNLQGILWRGEDTKGKALPEKARDGFQIVWKAGRGKPSLQIPAVVDYEDEVIRHAMDHPVKFCRVTWRNISGKDRFFVQLALEGHPLQVSSEGRVRRVLGTGRVGLDLGPSTVAIVSQETAYLRTFCETLAEMAQQERRIQRKMDRQRRANNPDNYDEKGSIKRGVRLCWTDSKNYLKAKASLGDLRRRKAATRKSLHGALVNEVLTLGDTFMTEDVSAKDWAKRKKGRKFSFGKSVSARAPGMFTALLKQRLDQLGGTYIEVPTRTTALSQTCQCGSRVKKSLGTRWHRCAACGVKAQRDLYSAFLCMFVEGKKLNHETAQGAWEEFQPVLATCVEDLRVRKSSGERFPSSFGV